MTRTLDTLEREALQLPEDQRLTLAHRMLRSTEPASPSSVESLWTAEIVRRIEALDAGATGLHEVSEVFLELDRRLSR